MGLQYNVGAQFVTSCIHFIDCINKVLFNPLLGTNWNTQSVMREYYKIIIRKTNINLKEHIFRMGEINVVLQPHGEAPEDILYVCGNDQIRSFAKWRVNVGFQGLQANNS